MVQLGYEEFKNNFFRLFAIHFLQDLTSFLLSFGTTSTPTRTKTGLGPKFTRLLPQDAVLLGSDSRAHLCKDK